MSQPQPKKTGLLGRFSNFLKSDSLSLGPSPNSSNAPSPNASPPKPATATTSKAPSAQSQNSPSPQHTITTATTTTGASGGAGSSSSTTTPQLQRPPSSPSLSSSGVNSAGGSSMTECTSPMCGPLESCATSFASSANHSMQRRSDDDGMHAAGSASSSSGGGGEGGKEDVFKMFSIIGPSFAASTGTTATATTTASTDDVTKLQTVADSSLTEHPDEGAEHHHHRQSMESHREERLRKLQEFFDNEGAKCVAENCAVSPARQRDILEKVAESDHDVDLALATLRSAYGLSAQSISVVLASETTPKHHDSQQHGGGSIAAATTTSNDSGGEGATPLRTGASDDATAAPTASATPTAAASAASAVSSPATIKRRQRSATIAKADLMTLLGPLVPERPISRSINTGNVHGNRYIAADIKAVPQQWFFFGGAPIIVDYHERTANIGQEATQLLLDERAKQQQQQQQQQHRCVVEAELSDAALIALVNEEIARADDSVEKCHFDDDIDGCSSSLSSEMSGRSFGSVVDMEEIVAGLPS